VIGPFETSLLRVGRRPGIDFILDPHFGIRPRVCMWSADFRLPLPRPYHRCARGAVEYRRPAGVAVKALSQRNLQLSVECSVDPRRLGCHSLTFGRRVAAGNYPDQEPSLSRTAHHSFPQLSRRRSRLLEGHSHGITHRMVDSSHFPFRRIQIFFGEVTVIRSCTSTN
jgi:hypothetical protein